MGWWYLGYCCVIICLVVDVGGVFGDIYCYVIVFWDDFGKWEWCCVECVEFLKDGFVVDVDLDEFEMSDSWVVMEVVFWGLLEFVYLICNSFDYVSWKDCMVLVVVIKLYYIVLSVEDDVFE